MPNNGPAPDGPKPQASPAPPPRKSPTGSGLIGQTGNKPGGSLEASVRPPRPELTDPRKYIPRHAPSEESGAFAASGFALIMFAAMAVGFILGRTL
jgi:hypothetical protein